MKMLAGSMFNFAIVIIIADSHELRQQTSADVGLWELDQLFDADANAATVGCTKQLVDLAQWQLEWLYLLHRLKQSLVGFIWENSVS